MRIAWLFPCVAILLLAACAHRDGRVGREMLLPEGAPRHPVDEERQRFIMAVPVRDPMPVIPDNMHRFRRTVAVCVGVVVTDDGRTVDVVAHEPGVACPQSTSVDATVHAHFRAATVAAVQDWTWFGAAICTFPEGVVPGDDCSAPGVELRAVPIRLDYRFVFTPGRSHASADR